MSLYPNYYNLYCLNMNCERSIYWSSVETRAEFNEVNLGSIHRCTCCDQPLSSSMDIEIKQVTAEAGVTLDRSYQNSGR
jgi:hypothetical protein